MSTKSQRPRPRQDRARQIVEMTCELIGVAGTRVPGGLLIQDASAGAFNVWKSATSTGSSVIDIWGPPTGHKLFSCELKPDGQIYLRSFRRGVWEDQFLSHAGAVVKAGFRGDQAPFCDPPGAGKTRLIGSLAMTPQSATD